MLKATSTVQTLRLGSNGIGPEGAIKIADALPANSSLGELDLRKNAIGTEGALAIGRALRARPRRTSYGVGFRLYGVELAEVAAELGLPDRDAGEWTNDSILTFFWEQHERRLAVCMLTHRRLGQGSRWGELDEGILRMVLGNLIHYGGG